MAKNAKTTQEGKDRTSLYLAPEMIRSIKYICFMDEKNQTEVIIEALAEYITKWEKKRGPVPPKS